MRAITLETASPISLRNCFKEVVGKVSSIYDFSEKGRICTH